MHPCEEDLVCKGSIEKVPYFNAPIYLENKSQIGKVDEIFGPMNSYVRFFFFFVIAVFIMFSVFLGEVDTKHEGLFFQI